MPSETTKLVLGRGEVYFDRFLPGARTGEGERYLGNTPSFQITREIRRLERATTYLGNVHALPGAVLSEDVSIRIATDHMAPENVDLWWSGEGEMITAGDEFVPFSEAIQVHLDRYYQLGANIVPGGFRYVDSLTASVGATPLLNGVDYTLDRDRARIRILAGAGRVADGDTVSVTYLKRPSANRVTVSQPTDMLGALRYIATDPYGPKVDYWFPRVRITPRGAVDLKVDEFRQLNFDANAIRLGPRHALVYTIQDGRAPTPITADTMLVTADTTKYTADNGRWEA